MAAEHALGTGLKFPPQVDPGTGRFVLSSGAQNVRESLYLILMTSRGERWLDPAFGSGILRYAFLDASLTVRSMLSHELRDLILTQEPRISDVEVDIAAEAVDGALAVTLTYSLAGGAGRDALAFPLVLEPGGGERP